MSTTTEHDTLVEHASITVERSPGAARLRVRAATAEDAPAMCAILEGDQVLDGTLLTTGVGLGVPSAQRSGATTLRPFAHELLRRDLVRLRRIVPVRQRRPHQTAVLIVDVVGVVEQPLTAIVDLDLADRDEVVIRFEQVDRWPPGIKGIAPQLVPPSSEVSKRHSNRLTAASSRRNDWLPPTAG